MAEYYAVLSKAVGGLEANSADARRAVYDKARNALIGQLKAIDPPLPTAEISRQRLELEEAIRRVERETSSMPSGAPVRVAPAKRTPAPERAASPSPQDVFRRAIQEAEGTTPEAPQPRAERAVAVRADDWSSDRIDRPTPPPAKPVPQYLPSQGYVEEKPRSDEPRLAPDYDYDWDPKAPPQPKPRTVDPVAGEARPASPVKAEKRGIPPPRSRPDPRDTMEHPSRLPMILLLVLIVAMVGGLGAFAYAYRVQLGDVLHTFDGNTSAPAPVVAEQPPPADTSGKDTDSLLSGSQPTVPGARVVGATADASTTTDTAPTTDTAAPAAPAVTASVDPDSLVAQRATLYEEPLNSTAAANGVVAINAVVTWSLGSGPEGAEIVGNIDVPERGLKIKLTVRRNSDQSLPASHVIEVVLDTPANFPGKGIKDVPRVVLKPSEEARGQPLIGASAKVADGFFWIALSGDGQDMNANMKLLKERTWIDLPLVYDSGQRAIITLEKGTPGERVFDKALAAWTG